MTPTELETFVRQRYNAVGDNFFPQAEIFNFFYFAQNELAQKSNCIPLIWETVSVQGQREYAYPATTIKIYRVEYNGKRIHPNDFLLDDSLTGNNPGDTTTGVPINYQIFGSDLFLRPIPSEAGLEIKIYGYDGPETVAANTTLSVPERYQFMLVDYALGCMFGQDKNHTMAQFHFNRWDKHVLDAIATEEKRRTSDEYPVVKDWETIDDGSGFY